MNKYRQGEEHMIGAKRILIERGTCPDRLRNMFRQDEDMSWKSQEYVLRGRNKTGKICCLPGEKHVLTE
jgi:hypothetical protein